MFKSFDELLAKDITTGDGLVAYDLQQPTKNLYPVLPRKRKSINDRLARLKARRDPFGLEKGFADFNSAIRDVNTNPSKAQIAAGNYKMGHIKFHGLDITIENPQGSWRHGVDPNGQAWSCQLPYHYGYIKGFGDNGADNDAVDIAVGPATSSKTVYVIDQIDPDTKAFDEHKVIAGTHSEFEARVLYQKGFSDGRGAERIGAITPMSIDAFKQWLKTEDTTEPVAYHAPMAKGFVDFYGNLVKAEPAEFNPILDIADEHVDTLSERIAKALKWLAGQGDTVAEAAVDGPHAAANAVPVADFGSKFDDAFETITNIVQKAGDHTANDNLPPAGDDGKTISFSFDAGNASVQDYLDDTKMGLIQQITDDQRQTIHDIVQNAMTNGDSTDTMKQSIRDVIGLTASQGQNVENYRDELENLDSGALSRALRDGRMDSKIQAAIDIGEPLDPDYIDKAVEAYKNRYINFRSGVIARTESLSAANTGARQGMMQLLDDPSMDGYTVKRTWLATKDNKTRPDHAALNGTSVIGMDAEYQIPDGGTIAYPCDPNADADERIQCRCTEKHKIIRDPDAE